RRFELLEGAGEAVRLAGDRGAAGIGVELTRPRDRRLDQHRCDRSQDERREQHDGILAFTIVAAAAKEHREARNHHHRRRKRRARLETMRCSRWSGPTSWAPYMRRTIVSENQYDAKLVATARTNPNTRPCAPPSASPRNVKSPVIAPSSRAVFAVLDIFNMRRGPTPAACAFAASPLGLGCNDCPL